MKKPEYIIATAVVLGALLFTAVLAYSIGSLRYSGGQKHIHVLVETAAGIVPNTPVKFAGAPIGRVESITVMPRSKQQTSAHGLYCVDVLTAIDSKVEVGNDVRAAIKQDGMLGSSYIAFTPVTKDSPVLADNATIPADPAADFNDLTITGQALLKEMLPVAKNLNGITEDLNQSLPELTKNLNDVLEQTDSLLQVASTPENKEKLTKLMSNLRVITDNLKVVTTNAKALTLTLAQKPWRLLWGGKTNPVPPESEVLKSDKVVPVQNVIEVTPAPAASN